MNTLITAALSGLFVWSPMASTEPVMVPVELPSYTVSMTAYNAVPGQTDSTPDITASGAFSNPDLIAARSRDLADELPFGTVIEITAASSSPNCGFEIVKEQIGLRVIGDTMNARMVNKIDILFDTSDTARAGGKLHNSARVLGRCSGVEIKVVGKIDIRDIPKTQKELRLTIGVLEKADAQNLAIKK